MGQPIIEHQAVGFRLAELATRNEVARQLVLHATSKKDGGGLHARGVDVQAVRLDGGRGSGSRGAVNARRTRLRRGLRDRHDLSRRARVPDLRGHVRYPAARDQPRARDTRT